MKFKLLLGSVILLAVGGSAFGQGAFVSGSAQGTVNGALRSLPGATVTVCAANTTGIPCSPPLANTLFKDQALTQPLANPTTTDANGNYNFAVAAGTYTLTITATGFTGSTQQITVTCGTGGCTATSLTVTGATTLGSLTVNGTGTFTGATTFTGTHNFTNDNNICWAGPGTTPTIDTANTLCATYGTPIRTEISPNYSGAESANITTTSFGAKVFNAANMVFDNRQNFGTVGQINSTTLYPIIYVGREMGALAIEGINRFNTGTVTDSTCAVCDTNFFGSPAGATFPSNGGMQAAHISVMVGTDKITINGSVAPFGGIDSETFWSPTTIDTAIPQIFSYTGQNHLNRSGALGNASIASTYIAQPCDQGSATGTFSICYGFDAFKNTVGSANYGFHNYGSWGTEINGTYDVFDAPVTITSCSEASTTVTCLATNTYTTSDTVLVQGVGGSFPTSTQFGYNGKFAITAATGTQFQYTAVSGLTAATGGTAKGVLQLINPQSSDESIRSTELSDSVGWIWQRRSDHVTIAQLSNSTGLKVAGGINPISDNGAFLGTGSLHFAGLFQTICQLGGAAGTTSPAACSGATSGMIAIPASQTTYTVNTSNVTANSLIFIQQMTDNSGLPSSPTCNSGATTPIQSARVAGTSFTFTLTSVASVTCIKFWIVN